MHQRVINQISIVLFVYVNAYSNDADRAEEMRLM